MFLSNVEYYHDNKIEILYFGELDHYWPRHNHSGYQILMLIEGVLEVIFPDRRITLQPGEYFIVPPCRPHVTWTPIPSTVLCINIDNEALTQDKTSLLDLMDEVFVVLVHKGLVERKHLVALSIAFSKVMRDCDLIDEKCVQFVTTTRQMLEQSPQHCMSVSEMGAIVSKCKDYLSREFKKVVGMAPHSFYLHNKIQKAARLVIYTEMTIDLITHECGFYDISHFGRHFRKIFGVSPSTLREAFRPAHFLVLGSVE